MARVAWIVRLVKAGAGGEGQGTDVIEIAKPDGLGDIANLGLSLSEAKLLLAAIQQEVVAAQARDHAIRRPSCRSCGGACQVKDYRQHWIATLFGQVSIRLPRFRCTEVNWRRALTGRRIAGRPPSSIDCKPISQR